MNDIVVCKFDFEVGVEVDDLDIIVFKIELFVFFVVEEFLSKYIVLEVLV